MRKFLNKFLPFIGIALTIAGLVIGILTNLWATEAISLLVSGLLAIFLWLLLFAGGKNSFWEKRTTQEGANALIATAAVITILCLANFLGNRYSYRADFTDNQLYTLAPETQEVVRNLGQPLQVYIFDRQIGEDDRALLSNYQRYNPLFEFEFIDPDKQINLTEQFKVKALGEVYIKYGDKNKLVQSLKLGENLSEIQLTNAIVQIQRDRTQFIYLLQGHGEVKLDDSEGGFSDAVNSLKAKGYQVEPLNLIQTKTIPDNANTLIIAGAKRKLFPAEVTTIKNYLDRGGKLLVMLDPDIETGLESILKEWGVESKNSLIIDASGTGEFLGYGVDTPVVGSYGNHPITKDFADGLSVYPQSRPLIITKIQDIESIPLAITSAETWAEISLEEPELSFDPTKDIAGPLNIAVALTRKISPTANNPTRSSPNPSELQNSTQNRQITPNLDRVTNTQNNQIKPSPSPKTTVSPQSFNSPQPQGDNSPPKVTPVSYIVAQNNNSSPSAPTSTAPTPKPTATVTATPTEKPTEKPSPAPKITPTTPTEKPTETKPIDRQVTANMVIFGNTTFATNGWFQQQLNSDIFINSVNWLADDSDRTLSIRPKQQKNRRINLTPTQAGILTWTSLLIVPLLGLTIAIITWWRRR
jgi:ABC-type uncharacterized transport system involved in gliding motility auxiliary subunit